MAPSGHDQIVKGKITGILGDKKETVEGRRQTQQHGQKLNEAAHQYSRFCSVAATGCPQVIYELKQCLMEGGCSPFEMCRLGGGL